MFDHLSIITWNARGVKNKKDELFAFLNRENVDICLLTESWLNSSLSIKNNNYFCYRCDRSSRRGGGVAIIIKKSIRHTLLPLPNTNLIESIGINITNNGTTCTSLFCCYFGGGRADPLQKQIFTNDLRLLTRTPGNLVLGGDFNSRHRLWGCNRANVWGSLLYNFSLSRGLSVHFPNEHSYVPASARYQSSTLDLFVSNNCQLLSNTIAINDLGSDHLPVQTILHSNYTKVKKFFYDIKNANWTVFGRTINRLLPDCDSFPASSQDDIDNLINLFSLVIVAAKEHSIPKREIKSSPKALPPNIISLIKLRNRHRRNWLRRRNIRDLTLVRWFSQLVNIELSKLRNENWNNLLSSLEKNSSPFWKLSKVIKKKYSGIPTLTHNQQNFVSADKKVELLASLFALNHSHSANLGDPSTSSEVNSFTGLLDSLPVDHDESYLTNVHEVSSILKELKSKKTPGLDNIENVCLKALPRKGVKFLSFLINECLRLGYFPHKWKISKVIPILKANKPPECPTSYRPISLLSSVSKILEKVIKKRLVDFTESNNVLSPLQYGFRREHNTIHPLCRIKKIVKANFSSSKSTGMVLLDIKAAFDSVWHEGLVYKMNLLHFPLQIIKIIRSFLKDRFFTVYIGDAHSRASYIPAGCPQGSCLSPILYNIYTSDFPALSGCTASIFADDTAILCSGKLATDISDSLQAAFNVLVAYFTKWKILINPEKTQAIYFTRNRKNNYIPLHPINLSQVDINWENNVKYLGVLLDKKLTFSDHVQFIIKKTNILIKVLYPFINRNSRLSLENKMYLFRSIFQSTIFYGAPVWADIAKTHICKIQVLQNKILKRIFNLPWHYPTAELHYIARVELASDRLTKLHTNFVTRCSYSSYLHLQNSNEPL